MIDSWYLLVPTSVAVYGCAPHCTIPLRFKGLHHLCLPLAFCETVGRLTPDVGGCRIGAEEEKFGSDVGIVLLDCHMERICPPQALGFIDLTAFEAVL